MASGSSNVVARRAIDEISEVLRDKADIAKSALGQGCDIHGAITPKGHFVLRISLEEDPKEEPEEEDENMVNDEEYDAEVINPYEEADPHNRPPPTFDEETEFAPPVVQTDDVPIPPVIQFGSNFHSVHRGVKRLSKQMHDRYRTEKKMAKKLRQDELSMNDQEFDITTLDSAVRENRSENSKIMKLIMGLSREFTELKNQNCRAEELSRWEAWVRGRITNNLRFQEEPSIYTALVPRADDPYVMMRDVAMDTRGDEDVNTDAPWDTPSEPRRSPRDSQIMPPKRRSQTNPQPTLTQEDIDQLVRDGIKVAIRAERESVRMDATRAGGPVGGPAAAPMARECSFAGFMKCGPTQFQGTEGAVGLIRWFEKMENTFEISKCAEGKKVKFATATLHGRALTWWNYQVTTLGHEVANGRPWAEVKQMMTDEFCPIKEVQRFNELALLCPDVVLNEKKKVELYIQRLPEIMKGETISSRPDTLNEVVCMAHVLMEQKIQEKNERIAEGLKRKWENNNQGNNNNNSHNRGATIQSNVVCYECGERGHKSRVCPKKADRRGGNVQGQAYVICDIEHNQGPNVVTGTFLLNNRYATMLFDFRADKSFVDIKFSHRIDIKPVKLNSSYEVELADGKVVSTNSVLRGCTLNLLDHLFDIDLMPIELGIQCAGFDTRPPMLDRTDFALWQQRIRLYCQGTENEVNILKSIDEGPYQMGTVRELLAEGTEGAPHFGPERPRVYSDLSPEEKDRYNADIWATNILLQGLPKDIYTLINHYIDAKDIWDNHKGESIHDYYVRFSKLINYIRNIKMTMSRMQLNSKFVNNMLAEWGRSVKLNRGLRDSNYDQLGQWMNPRGGGAARYGGGQNRVGNVHPGQARPVKCYNCNALDAEQLLFLVGGQDNAVDDDVDEQPVQDLVLNVDNVFQADDYDAFDSDVDEAPTAQTMFMANLSSADPVSDEAGPSCDSDILSEVQDYDHYQDAVCAHHEEHAMHDSVQLDHVGDSHADYTSDSNMIPYDQYVKDNEVPVVHSNVSSVLNDAFMMIYNDMCEPHTQSVSNPSRNTVVKNSLTAELATYKEQVELYERWAKLQLASTINHNKSMVEEVTFLKKDFKQKENKYLEDFLDMKSLKEKVEDRLIKQDQSLQIVHLLCRPNPYYNELNNVAIGYKNPLCLTRAKQVQPALYNGHEIIKDNHAPAIVHNTEDTIEIAEITRKKMNDKMKDPECVTRKVKIEPHDYSKDNFFAIFTPQKQLTHEQIFWSNDLIKLKFKALKEQTTVSRPIKALTVKHDAIERKNLLIANDNLIAEYLSKEVFSVAKNFKLNVARFTEMHVANTIVEACCLALEAKLANLRDKSHHHNQEELINYFSKLEVNHLNLQLKYQNLKDSLENNPPTPDKDTPDFDSVFVIGKMQAYLQGKDNVICQLKKQISQLQVTRSDTDRTLKVRTVYSHITKLTEQVTNLKAQNNLFRAENDKIKQHYKELYDSIKITCAQHIEQVTALTTKNVNLKSQTLEKVNSVSKDLVKPKVLARGKHAIDVELIVPRLRNNRDAHLDYLRHLKESFKTIRDIVEEDKVVRQLDRSIVSAWRYTKQSQELLEYAIGTCCSKHMTGDRSWLMNFVKKFIGTARFGNDHFGHIMGYGDYVIGDSVISRVYYVEGLGHNLFSVGQFCDSDLEVAFKKHSCYVQDTDGVKLIKGSRVSNLYTISVEDMMKSSPICLLSKASKNKSWL
uniref:Reverse transcriptase domain-containing protein n=1 Tax=Tanacetum cinerariifolium TaxID=118510 RepID=A0A6L2J9A0_TANCI|nr:reverse transcriptase domain-containing protein [Tanacetum cinerariifolium]